MTTTAITTLKKEVKKWIDDADEQMAKTIHAMLQSDRERDWWDDISEAEKEAIEAGLRQLKNGRGIPHSEVKQKYPQWLAK